MDFIFIINLSLCSSEPKLKIKIKIVKMLNRVKNAILLIIIIKTENIDLFKIKICGF
jgi:hypothetical protein